MTCEEVRISLGVYVLGALDAEETTEVEAHLDTCAACRAELADLSGLPPLLARVTAEDIERAAAPPRAVLDGVVAGVGAGAGAGAGAETGAVATARTARRGRRSQVLLALAASVVVAAVGGTAWVSGARTASDEMTSVAAAPATRSAEDSAADAAAAGQAPAAEQDTPQEPQLFELRESAAPSQAPSPGAVAKKVQDPPAQDPAAQDPAAQDPAAQNPRVKATATAPHEARGRVGDARIAVRLVPHDGGTQVVARVAGVPAGTVCTLRAVAKDGAVSVLGSWTVGAGEFGGQKMVLEGSTASRPGEIDRIELTDSGGHVLVTAKV
ncbi:anti-sigma factor [Microbispora sp. H11081]|uniref:anti-sigma factor family protein n=1 Tax=Microbispora sp. H11081 TaxID=2729107 RepID=UPI0014756C1F|nr:zf-HC2 domain-containing protein [Microbispora sp. H11081]